ncbi:MAG: hypothetical protein KAW02_05280 [candidate division Zixibacteria bacterium]|nr:hypothetical protein [candidate division Zixibacteria bacterium]
MTELIKGDAPIFIILTYAAAMMAVVAAQLNYIERLGLSKFSLFPPLEKINMFSFGLIAFVCFLINQLLALLNIAFQTHFLDVPIVCLFLLENGFVISWIVWIIAARKEYN